ncbi:MAG: alpha/beta hydrolase [Lachnospiraceae bacterium]|nr:alpha/beta hydrolase [Lachnospiraceae bacterium]
MSGKNEPQTPSPRAQIAVVFPGIGYHKDKPLLYYATKLVQAAGYDVIHIEYHDMPQKIRGNAEMMKKAALLAIEQTEEQLKAVKFSDYEKVLLVGKSIGTVVLAKYASDHNLNAKQVWYTPVEATFSYPGEDVIAFIGDADPWSDVSVVKEKAASLGISLHSYPDCNHSLETGDVNTDTRIIHEVMGLTERFLDPRGRG